MRQGQRRLLMGFFFAAAAPLLVASVAFACQKITPMHASPTSGAAGSEIQVNGTNFDTRATSSNVEIRWDQRDGPSLASIPVASLGPQGSFQVTVRAPADAAIGDHILIATQTLENGEPCVGCPGRANFEVVGAGAQASSNSAAVAPASDRNTSSTPTATSEPAASEEPVASQPAPAQPAPAPQAAPAQAAPAQAAVPPQRPVAPASASRPAPAAAADYAPTASPAAVAPAAPAPATSPEASPVAPAAPIVGSSPAPAPAGVELVGSGSSTRTSSPMPVLTLVAGLVLVLLGLGAFWRSGRSVLGGDDRALIPAG